MISRLLEADSLREAKAELLAAIKSGEAMQWVADAEQDLDEAYVDDTMILDSVNDWDIRELDLVTIEEMPEYLRSSHRAAGNWGDYPLNGSIRRKVSRREANDIVEADEDGYDHIVV